MCSGSKYPETDIKSMQNAHVNLITVISSCLDAESSSFRTL